MPFLDTMVLLVIECLSGLAWTFPLRATEPLAQTMEVNAICPIGTSDCVLFLARTAIPTSDVVHVEAAVPSGSATRKLGSHAVALDSSCLVAQRSPIPRLPAWSTGSAAVYSRCHLPPPGYDQLSDGPLSSFPCGVSSSSICTPCGASTVAAVALWLSKEFPGRRQTHTDESLDPLPGRLGAATVMETTQEAAMAPAQREESLKEEQRFRLTRPAPA